MSPKIAQTIYQAGTVVSAILGILLLWKGIDQGTADGINSILAGIGVLIPGGASATAAKRVATQRADGTLSKDPVVKIQAGLQEAGQIVASAQAGMDIANDVQRRARQAISATLDGLPFDLGKAANEALGLDVS